MSFDVEQAVNLLQNEFPQDIISIKKYRNETTILVGKDKIREICRYEVVYHVHRFGPECEENVRIRLKAELTDNDPNISSVVSVWSTADWLEREVYDMFGIKFNEHPDLRRILMPEDYGPHPLKKDFDVRNREASKESFKKALEDGPE